MWSYVVRRFGWILITLAVVSAINFGVVFLVPGNPAETIGGEKATPQVIAQIEKYYGLDRPVYVQYAYYMWHLVHGDLGTSYETSLPVGSEIDQRLGPTALLAVCAFVLEIIFGVAAGLIAGVRPGSRIDLSITSLALLFNSLPAFWVGTMLLFLLGFKLPIFPLSGYGPPPHLLNVALPALVLGVTGAAAYARLLRTQMAEVRTEDFVRTARAKGLDERVVNLKHIARNALMPVVTLAGLDLANLLSGLIIIETVFGWPGIGQLTYQAVTNLDIPVIMATAMLSALLVVLANFGVDMIYMLLDPRVTYH